MAKAELTLKDGTVVKIDGSPEEIQKIIQLHHSTTAAATDSKKSEIKKSKPKASKTSPGSGDGPDLMEVVNAIKSCDEAENIEKNILDRTSQVDQILLPLHIGKKHHDASLALTSGEIAKILNDLGIKMHSPNISNTLSGPASKYVIGDKVRKPGQPVRYKISRRGEQYMDSVINNKAD